MSRIEKTVFALALLATTSPAFAGAVGQVPAPAIGLGIGAVVLIGAGYRAMKGRIK